MTEQNPKKIHRIFHYNENTRESTPVKEVRINEKTILIPVELDKNGCEIPEQPSNNE